MKGYCEEDIITKVRNGIVKIDEFYKNEIINYTGKLADKEEKYSEAIAAELLNLDIKSKLAGISEIVREKGYAVKGHNGSTKNSLNQTNRYEEHFALRLFNESQNGKVLNELGKIIDYQVQLKNKLKDNAGKIDLISKNDESIYLIELKTENSKETILRSILEISTYYQVLSKPTFIDSYKTQNEKFSPKDIKKAVLIVEGSAQYKEIRCIASGEGNNLKRLIEVLNVSVFSINKESLDVQKEC